MTAHKKLQFRLNIKHATSREQGYFKWVTICALFKIKRFNHIALIYIVLQLFTHQKWTNFISWWQKVTKLKILCDYFDWYFLMIYCLVFINWLMIDVDHNIKARLQWIKTVDSHEFGICVLNTIMGRKEMKLYLLPSTTPPLNELITSEKEHSI